MNAIDRQRVEQPGEVGGEQRRSVRSRRRVREPEATHVPANDAMMPAEQIERWADVLRKALGKEPVVKHVVRPELIAGAIVRAGDVVADGSARRRLNELKQRIIRRGKHALQS